MKAYFVADFFIDDVVGGAEKNDAALIQEIEKNNINIEKIRCSELTAEFIDENSDRVFIVGNFVSLSFSCLMAFNRNQNHIIYEHDYKLFKNRNPIGYRNFIAPASGLTNLNFYKNAYRTVFLSKLQETIFQNNFTLSNRENIHCSIFDDETLDFIGSINGQEKISKVAIVDSANPIKKTAASIRYCKENDLKFDLIKSSNYFEFLKILGSYERLLILTGHPEPTPRIAVEAKMLNTKVLCQKNLIGVASEEWYNQDGDELIGTIRQLRKSAGNLFKELIFSYDK